ERRARGTAIGGPKSWSRQPQDVIALEPEGSGLRRRYGSNDPSIPSPGDNHMRSPMPFCLTQYMQNAGDQGMGSEREGPAARHAGKRLEAREFDFADGSRRGRSLRRLSGNDGG